MHQKRLILPKLVSKEVPYKPPNMDKSLTLRVDSELLDLVDSVRGDLHRTEFFRRAAELVAWSMRGEANARKS